MISSERSNSMIRVCTCSGGSASAIQLPRYRAGSKLCKCCGGKVSVDEQSTRSGSMLSNAGLELTRVADPSFNWKVCVKGRQRALRRARTSFSGGSHRGLIGKGSKEIEDFTHRDSKIHHIPVSESEKLGVSILGRRFINTPESVPIKKRKLLLARSPSPPSEPFSRICDSDRILEIRSSSFSETELNATQNPVTNAGPGVNSHHESIAVGEDISLDIYKDSADFSGISLLAAAACDSNIGDDTRSVEDSVPRGCSSDGEAHLGFSKYTVQQSITPAVTNKESDEKKDDSLHNLHNPVSSLENVLSKRRMECPSHDNRLHWDLNIVMDDTWENQVVNSVPHPPTIGGVGEDCSHATKSTSEDILPGEVSLGDTKAVLNTGGHQDGLMYPGWPSEVSNLQDKEVSAGNNSVVDHHIVQECSIAYGEDDVFKDNNEVDDIAIASLNATDNADLSSKEENNSLKSVGAPIAAGVGSSSHSSLEGEIVDANCISVGSILKRESSGLVAATNSSIDSTVHACELPPMRDIFSEVVPEKKVYGTSTPDNGINSDLAGEPARETSNLRSPASECKLHAYDDNVDAGKANQHLIVNEDVDDASNVLLDKCVHKDVLDQSTCYSADKSKFMSACSSSSPSFISLPSGNHDDLSSGNAELDATANSFDKLEVSKIDYSVEVGSKLSGCNSMSTTIAMVDVPCGEGPSSVQGAYEIYADADLNSHKVALEDQFDLEYDSDASQIDGERASGMEKVELQQDNDSPYEDGEFRDSVFNSWGEEGVTEHVDYGSEDRDTDTFEATSILPASGLQLFNSSGCKNEQQSRTADDDCSNEVHPIEKFTRVASQPQVNCFSMTDSSDADFGNRCVKNDAKEASRGNLSTKGEGGHYDSNANAASESGAVSHKNIGECTFLANGKVAHSRNKSTGWDRLPEFCRSSGDAVLDSGGSGVYQKHIAESTGASETRVAGLSFRKNLSSQIEGRKPSDVARVKDNLDLRTVRNNCHQHQKLRVGRDDVDHRSVGTVGSSLTRYGRSREDQWMSGHDNWGHAPHDLPGLASSTHSGVKNAAAAAVAKVESNGFVVAPDGTLVKAGGLGPTGRVLRHSVNSSSQRRFQSLGRHSPVESDRSYGLPLSFGNSRDSPDWHVSTRQGRAHWCGPRMESVDYRKSYHKEDTSAVSLHHPLSRRERSFSPRGRPIHMSRSRTRSPSRSRTRSPHMWTSSSRSDNRMNGVSGLRPLGRSQNLKSQARLGRMRSPNEVSGFGDRRVRYSPLSRDHASPPHVSRWVRETNNLPEFGEHEYTRSSERSPARKFSSRNRRFDGTGSPRQLKLDKQHQAEHSGRLAEFIADRGPRHDDRRGNVDRYENDEMLHAVRQYGSIHSRRHFDYVFEDDSRVRNTRPKISSKFDHGGSSRDYCREVETHLGESARNADKKGNVIYGRVVKHTDSV